MLFRSDKFSKQVARKIEQARSVKPIETTTELAEIIKSAKPAKELKKKGHPAKQIFQAIRIEVNDELGAADESIQQAIDLLAADGRIAVITFHSLEDRLTKQIFKEASTVDVPMGNIDSCCSDTAVNLGNLCPHRNTQLSIQVRQRLIHKENLCISVDRKSVV